MTPVRPLGKTGSSPEEKFITCSVTSDPYGVVSVSALVKDEE
jgi:hypothetical protein